MSLTVSLERGLRLFERVTYLEEYYPTNAEIEVLKSCAESLVQRLPNDCRLIELGSGFVNPLPSGYTYSPCRACSRRLPLLDLHDDLLDKLLTFDA